MENITGRRVVAVALRLLAIALLAGAVALTGVAIYVAAWAIGIGAPSGGSLFLLFLLTAVAPVVGAIVVWKAASRIVRGGQSSIP